MSPSLGPPPGPGLVSASPGPYCSLPHVPWALSPCLLSCICSCFKFISVCFFQSLDPVSCVSYPLSEPPLSHVSVPQDLRKTASLSVGASGTPAPLFHQFSVSVPSSVFPVTCSSGTLELSTPLIAAHQLYNYVADHASSYHMKPLRMARPGGPEHNEYALVSAWHR